MTPGARIQAAVEIIQELEATALPADRFLRDWFRARRYAGSKDRAAIAERVYDVFRHRASFAWRMGSVPRALLIASLIAEGKSGEEISSLFTGGYTPSPLTNEEHAVILRPPSNPPPAAQGEYPEWLEPELTRGFGDRVLDEMKAMVARAPVDIRVNTLKASRNEVISALHSLGYKADATPFAPNGIRIPSGEGLGALQKTPLFEEGAFEFQDEASQIGAALCAAKPGQRVLDLAAGAGGKSLALAAAMQNKGEILAFDDSPQRLKPLRERMTRAGADIIKTANNRGGPLWGDGKFDVVLVDAPCSGSGTWRRSPELKWRLTQDKLAGLTKLQDWLIADGARHTRAGGRLIYATCSILPVENEDRIEAFLKADPDFRVVEAKSVWSEMVQGNPPPGMGKFFHASPRTTGTDGFFVCVMENHMDLKKGGH